MASREDLIQARSIYIGTSTNLAPNSSNLIVDGLIGVGTTNPGERVSISGNVGFQYSGNQKYHVGYYSGGLNFAETNIADARLFIKDGGNVGIGISSPSYLLDVNGTGRFLGNATSSPSAIFNNPTGAGGTAQYYTEFNAGSTVIGRIFRGNGASGVVGNGLNIDNFDGFQVRVNQLGGSGGTINLLGGNVGIGTTAPTNRLDVIGTSYFSSDIYVGQNRGIFFNGNGGYNIGVYSSGSDFVFQTSGSEKMRITSGGSLLIGSTTQGYNPQTQGYLFGVKSNTTQSFISIAKSGQTLDTQGMIVGLDNTTGYVWMRESTDLTFGTNNTTRVTINSSGNVGIGVTNPSKKLVIAGNSNGTALIGDAGFTDYTGISLNGTLNSTYYNILSSPYDNSLFINRPSGNDIRFRLDNYDQVIMRYDGTMGIGTTVPYTKLDVTDYTSYLSLTSSINVEATTDGQPIGGINFRKHYGLAIGASIRMLQDGGTSSYVQAALAFYTNNGSIDWTTPIERMRISNQGYIGIGTPTPNKQLTFAQAEDDAIQIRRYTTSQGNPYAGTGISWTWSDSTTDNETWAAIRAILPGGGNSIITFSTTPYGGQSNLTERMWITDSGRIGIGLANPQYNLHVQGNDFMLPATLGITHYLGVGAPLDFYMSANAFGDASLNLSLSTNITFNINYSEIMRLQPDGSVGVGTSYVDPSAILDVTSRRKGFLPPRMSNSDMNAIPSPAAGLVVYDMSNNKLCVYNGSSWVPLH